HIVEDDIVYGKIIEKALSQDDGYDVTLFTSGEELLNNLHQNPDIVSIDYHLPVMNGLQILKRVKEYNPNIAVIILSGQENVEVVVEAYDNGANRYIVKDDKSIVELKNSIKNFSSKVLLQQEIERLREQVVDRNRYRTIVGE